MREYTKPEDKELLTPKQVAKRLAVSYSYILNLIHKGVIEAINVSVDPKRGGSYRIRAGELNRLMTKVKTRPEREAEGETFGPKPKIIDSRQPQNLSTDYPQNAID
jgi:excisionase family DNA binding protein